MKITSKIFNKLIKKPNLNDETKLWFIDELKAISLIVILIYHVFFDLEKFFNIKLENLKYDYMSICKFIAAGTFIFIAGINCKLSKDNLRRGMKYLTTGFMLTVVTNILAPNFTINFGLLHMIGAAIILYHFISKLATKLHYKTSDTKLTVIKIVISLASLILTSNFEENKIGPFNITISEKIKMWLFPIGIKAKEFYSADYFPIFPWIFVFILGIYAGKLATSNQLPSYCYKLHFKPAASISQNAILIYLLHQPILIGFLYLIVNFIVPIFQH